jgi:hypothetical protein
VSGKNGFGTNALARVPPFDDKLHPFDGDDHQSGRSDKRNSILNLKITKS